MIDLLSTLLDANLSDLLGELYAPTCACLTCGCTFIAVGAVAELFKHTFAVIFGLSK